MQRRKVLTFAAAAFAAPFLPLAPAQAATDPGAVLTNWYRLVLELVRHTATYSPPVAARAFAYLGVTAYQALAANTVTMQSLAGQLTDLAPLPMAESGAVYDQTVVLGAALADAVEHFFGNTGPTGQRAMKAMTRQMEAGFAGLPEDVLTRSQTLGQAIAAHVIAWSQDDGGAVVENMGFPYDYALTEGPSHWVPTGPIRQQQVPLLPHWGKNRPFAMASSDACALPGPPAYSEDPTSSFYAEAQEVVAVKAGLTDEQKRIARFWSDDPMLSPTPPGHWIAIALQIIARDGLDAVRSADVLARLGVAVADAFIACWDSKFDHDLLRPITYIRRLMDPKWEALLITPPFPEYPSGHSTQSGAAAAVMTAIFGENFAFSDATHVDDGIAAREFASFWAAADEAALSRLYGGIHFRAAIERGLEQGRCVGATTIALRTL